jgi:hypothetical protein
MGHGGLQVKFNFMNANWPFRYLSCHLVAIMLISKENRKLIYEALFKGEILLFIDWSDDSLARKHEWKLIDKCYNIHTHSYDTPLVLRCD